MKNRFLILARGIVSIALQPIPVVGGALDSLVTLITSLLPTKALSKRLAAQLEEALDIAMGNTYMQSGAFDTARRILSDWADQPELLLKASSEGVGINIHDISPYATPSDYHKLYTLIMKNLYTTARDYQDLFNDLLWDQCEALREQFDKLTKKTELLQHDVESLKTHAERRINADRYIEHTLQAIKSLLKAHETYNDPKYNVYVDVVADTTIPSWKENVLNALRTFNTCCHNGLERDLVSQLISQIKGKRPYSQIRREVDKLLVDLYAIYHLECDTNDSSPWVHSYENLQSQSRHSFEKLAIISGEPGSGKTQFVSDYLNSTLDISHQVDYPNDRRIALLIRWDELAITDDINSFLIKKVNAIDSFNGKFETLNEIDEYLIAERIRLCLIVDDFQNIYHRSHARTVDFFQTLENTTCFEQIDWLLTVNEHDMYVFSSWAVQANSIMDYCIFLEKRVSPQVRYRISLCTVHGFDFNLTLYHENFRTYVDILTESRKDDISELSELLYQDDTVLQKLYNPRMCHYAVDFCATYADILSIISNVYYYEFVSAFIVCFSSNFKPDTQAAVAWCCKQALARNTNIFFVSDLPDFSLYALQLKTANLIITRLYDAPPENVYKYHGETEEHYKLDPELFWSFRIFASLVDPLGGQIQKIMPDGTFKDSSEFIIRMTGIDSYRNNMVQFAVEYFERIDKAGMTLLYQYTVYLLMSDTISPVFAMTRYLSQASHRMIAKAIIDNAIYIESIKVETVFALMGFFRNAKISAKTRINLLELFINRIDQAGYLVFFEPIITHFVESIEEMDDLQYFIHALALTQSPDVNRVLGRCVAPMYRKLCRATRIESVFDSIDLELKFLLTDVKFCDALKEIGNDSFIAWLLRQLVHHCVLYPDKYAETIRQGLQPLDRLYMHMRDNNFFFSSFKHDPALMKHKRQLEALYRRTFANATGDLYSAADSGQSYKKSFRGIIQDLMGMSDLMDAYQRKHRYLFAFYMIENSLREGFKASAPLDTDLCSLLKIIVNSGLINDHLLLPYVAQFVNRQLGSNNEM